MAIIAKISNQFDRLSNNEQKIAQVILDAPESVVGLSSSAFAEQAGVSQSSIIKLAQKLGFKGFPALKQALNEELTRKKVLDVSGTLHGDIQQNDTAKVMAQKLSQSKLSAIVETTNALDYENLDQAVTVLNKANKVHLVGLGGSAIVMKDLSYKLMKIGITALCELDSHVQITIAQTLNANDVMVVCSFTGNRKEVVIAAEIAKQRGATLIAITGLNDSPIRRMADIQLDTIADEAQARTSAIYSRTAQNCITDLLFMALIQTRNEEAIALIDSASNTIGQL